MDLSQGILTTFQKVPQLLFGILNICKFSLTVPTQQILQSGITHLSVTKL